MREKTQGKQVSDSDSKKEKMTKVLVFQELAVCSGPLKASSGGHSQKSKEHLWYNENSIFKPVNKLTKPKLYQNLDLKYY